MKIKWFLPAVGLLVCAARCAASDVKPPLQLTGNILIDGPLAISNGPPKDKVLWEYRTAAAALRTGDYGQAKGLLDDALLSLGGNFGKDKNAKKARGLFHNESSKNFLGEPYERVMAYYYRGILYWMDGEPDNARACFRSGQLEDSSVEDKYAGDYIILDYLDGLATAKLGGDGSDARERAVKSCGTNNTVTLPTYDTQANVMVFIEFGPGPEKYATGKYHEELRIRVMPSEIHSASIKVDDQTISVPALDDLGFQATTRGGRVMDHILGNKAVFKTGTDIAGNIAMTAGAATILATRGKNRDANIAGGILLGVGLLGKIASAATTPQADIRAWDNLPKYLGFAALRLPPGQHAVKIEFLDAKGLSVPNLTKDITFVVNDNKTDKVLFVSERNN